MLRLLATVLVLTQLAIAPAFADDETSACKLFIDGVHGHTLSILSNSTMGFTQKHSEISALFEASVDIDWLARHAAGEYWNKATDEQRKNYLTAYRKYLIDYYISSIDENDLAGIQDIALTKFDKIEDHIFHARLKIVEKSDDPVDVNLHLVENPAGICRIHDFSVEGVSMAASQREEIQSLGQIGGLELITQKLAEHKSKN